MSKPSPARYRTTNCSIYSASLRKRGSLLIWLDKEMAWLAPHDGSPGRPAVCSDAAIQFCLTIKVLFKQLPALRTSVQIATFKAGDKRKTEHTHLFLPKGYDGDPVVALYSPWTEQEVLDHLEKGWGKGAVIDLRLGFLYGA